MIIVQEETTKNPITLIGKEAGICYNSNTKDDDKNYKRGLGCINSGHGRTLEYPQIYLIIDEYSAKVIRELYTHIGGLPTRLQASTRYIDYNKDMFQYVTPPSIQRSELTSKIYDKCMGEIHKAIVELESLGIPREDSSFLMPLGMTTKIVFRTDLRLLVDMSHQRLCSRALWEYQKLMHDIMKALSEYSDEWKTVVEKLFVPKCDICGYCTEAKSCGRKPKLKGEAL